jgi:hypothetical protein
MSINTTRHVEPGRLPPLNLDFQKHVSDIDLGHYTKRRLVGIETERTHERTNHDVQNIERPSLTARENDSKRTNPPQTSRSMASARSKGDRKDDTEQESPLWELHGLIFKPPRPHFHVPKFSGTRHRTPFEDGTKDMMASVGGGMIVPRARLGRPKRWITIGASSPNRAAESPPSFSRPEVRARTSALFLCGESSAPWRNREGIGPAPIMYQA